MANALNKYAPIQSGIMSTIHAYTGDQMILDGPHRKGDLRGKSWCCKASFPITQQVLQRLSAVAPGNGKLIGFCTEFQFQQVQQQSLQLIVRVLTFAGNS